MYSFIRILLATLFLPALAAAEVTVYPSVGYPESHEFQVEINHTSVRVDHILDEHVAYFSFTGQADIVIRVRDPIDTWSINPVNDRIPSVVEKDSREIRISLTEPRRLVVYVNNLPRLLIWAEAPEKDPPRLDQNGVINVGDYGVIPDGKHLGTAAIAKAIAAVPAQGVLYFPPGIYRTGTVSLKSHMTLYLAPGARIVGSSLRDDFPKIRDRIETDTVRDPDNRSRKGKDLSYRQLLLIDNAEDVTVRGRGFIDGNGTVLRPQGLFIYNTKVIQSRNVRFEGIVFTNSPAWNLHLLYSDHIVVRDAKLIANFNIANSDGIDPDASSHVLIEDNFFLCNDDFVVVKITGNAGLLRDVDDIVVRRNVAIAQASALKVGTEVQSGYTVRNVTFIDNDIIESDRGMALYMEDGGSAENIRFINNRFDRLFIDDRQRLIQFYVKDIHGKGSIRDVLIKDCTALVPWPQASTIEGLEGDHGITDVRIENFVIAGRVVKQASDIPLNINAHVEGVTFNDADTQP